ncbi:MAG TPA: indole-3-glycerol phosphate synthase TrpC [Candidatus Methylacidiphilales bacterium]
MSAQPFADKLREIIASKEAEWQRLLPHADLLRRKALERNGFRPFRPGLLREPRHSIIAEVKKASPSAGDIVEAFDPITQAREYEKAGAHALSILTDKPYFKGDINYLAEIRTQVALPLLRKDFIVHELQVYESVVAGADAILLIVAALPQETLVRLYELARTLQLDVLVEVHDLPEMERALDLGADIIGINNRNLSTFEVTLQTTADLAEEIPNDAVAVSESGIKTADDVRFLREHGVNSLLVGETLMRAKSVSDKMRELLLEDED